MGKRFFRSFLIAAGLWLIAWPPAAAQPLQKMRALIPVKSIDEAFSPFTVAKYLGYFEAEGLDVSLLAVGGSNEVAIQISAGNAEVGAASPAEALIGMQSGQLDVRYYYDCYYRNIWSITVPEESPIRALAELRGKRLGVQAMGSAGITFGRGFLRAAGLDPQKDIAFLPIGMGAQAIQAVRQKMVDGIVFWDAALVRMAHAGLKLRPLSVPAVPMTLSPMARPNCAAAVPTPPLAPWMRSVSPALAWEIWESARNAVAYGTNSPAPWAKEIFSGSGRAPASATSTSSA